MSRFEVQRKRRVVVAGGDGEPHAGEVWHVLDRRFGQVEVILFPVEEWTHAAHARGTVDGVVAHRSPESFDVMLGRLARRLWPRRGAG